MADDAMREIIDRIRSREGDAVWCTSRLAAHLTRVGLQQSQTAGWFSPRSSLVGSQSVEAPPSPAEDPWPFLSGEP
jgi:hypothetical protein